MTEQEQIVAILRHEGDCRPYADASNETVRVKALLLHKAADEIERMRNRLEDAELNLCIYDGERRSSYWKRYNDTVEQSAPGGPTERDVAALGHYQRKLDNAGRYMTPDEVAADKSKIGAEQSACQECKDELPSLNWRNGKPYSYCPECGREEDHS